MIPFCLKKSIPVSGSKRASSRGETSKGGGSDTIAATIPSAATAECCCLGKADGPQPANHAASWERIRDFEQLQIFPLVFPGAYPLPAGRQLRRPGRDRDEEAAPLNGGEWSEAHLAGGSHEARPNARIDFLTYTYDQSILSL
jgi:hypothetical protein